MKHKAIRSLFIFILILIGIFSFYQLNYKNLDEVVSETVGPIDEILYQTEYKGYTMVFYSKDNSLYVGLVEQTLFGYRWSFGVGSNDFNDASLITHSVSNLGPRNMKSEEQLVSLTMGIINDNSIKELLIKYKDAEVKATILETSKGRFWYCFSESPLNYTPEVTITYNDGTTKEGWH